MNYPRNSIYWRKTSQHPCYIL